MVWFIFGVVLIAFYWFVMSEKDKRETEQRQEQMLRDNEIERIREESKMNCTLMSLRNSDTEQRIRMIFNYYKRSKWGDTKWREEVFPRVLNHKDFTEVLKRCDTDTIAKIEKAYQYVLKLEKEDRELVEKEKEEEMEFYYSFEKLTSSNGKRSGVYYIINILTNEVYIGSSENMYYRMNQHIKMMRSLNHHSYKLNNAIEKYSINNFEFRIAEYTAKTKSREQWYINRFNPDYNVHNDAFSNRPLSNKGYF
jgi:hypothetical protein